MKSVLVHAYNLLATEYQPVRLVLRTQLGRFHGNVEYAIAHGHYGINFDVSGFPLFALAFALALSFWFLQAYPRTHRLCSILSPLCYNSPPASSAHQQSLSLCSCLVFLLVSYIVPLTRKEHNFLGLQRYQSRGCLLCIYPFFSRHTPPCYLSCTADIENRRWPSQSLVKLISNYAIPRHFQPLYSQASRIPKPGHKLK